MTRGDARRRDATRRAAGVTRTSLSLAVSLSLSLFPSTVFSRFCSPSFSSIPLSLSLSVRCSAFLPPSPLHALFDRLVSSLSLLRSACPGYLCPSSDAHRSPLACIAVYIYIYMSCTRVYVRMCMRTMRHGLELYSSQDPLRIRTCRPQLLHPRRLPRSSGASILLAEQLRQSLELPQCPICRLPYTPACTVARMRVSRIPMIRKE